MAKRYRRRKVRWRSHRQLRQILFAFGLAGATLGVLLCLVFSYGQQFHLVGIGAVYLAASGLLLGIRGVLGHLDELHRHRRENTRSRVPIREIS